MQRWRARSFQDIKRTLTSILCLGQRRSAHTANAGLLDTVWRQTARFSAAFIAPISFSTKHAGHANLTAVPQSAFAARARAIGATKHICAAFHSVTDDSATAMSALWRQHLDCAFETVEDVGFAFAFNFYRFVVIVSAMFALSHTSFSS